MSVGKTSENGLARRAVVVLVAMALAFHAAPALANHETPFDGPDHFYGEMVDYDLVFPVDGPNRYSDSFWAERGSGVHHAQDIMADKLTPVLAAADGVISWVSSRCCTLAIRHDDGWRSAYIHLNNDSPGTDDGQGYGIADGIAVGTRVRAGQVIGWVGDSGNAEGTAPHLHFELEDPDGVSVNAYDSLLVAEGQAPPVCEAPGYGSLGKVLRATEVLERGTRSGAVRQLERFLIVLGYDLGRADKVYRGATVRAVKAFQRDQSIDRDGRVGPQTRATIAVVADWVDLSPVLADDGRVVRPGARGDAVRDLQRLLAAAGFSAGSPDGVYGDRTVEAVSAFQRAHGVTVDGKLGPVTRRALADALGLGNVELCS